MLSNHKDRVAATKLSAEIVEDVAIIAAEDVCMVGCFVRSDRI